MLLGKMLSTNQLDYVALIINYLKKSRVGGVQYGIYGYIYLKHIIEFCPGGCIQKLSKTNEEICERN